MAAFLFMCLLLSMAATLIFIWYAVYEEGSARLGAIGCALGTALCAALYLYMMYNT